MVSIECSCFALEHLEHPQVNNKYWAQHNNHENIDNAKNEIAQTKEKPTQNVASSVPGQSGGGGPIWGQCARLIEI